MPLVTKAPTNLSPSAHGWPSAGSSPPLDQGFQKPTLSVRFGQATTVKVSLSGAGTARALPKRSLIGAST